MSHEDMTKECNTKSIYDLYEINAQIEALKAKAAEVRQQARAEAIERCNFFIQEFDIAAFEMKFREAKAKKPRKAKESKEAKAPTHRGPNGELWTESNQGRKPNWITALIASGSNPEEYRIKNEV